MKDLFDKIFDELYSHKLTLQSLVSNIHVENYTNVNFYKHDGKIICETKCYLENQDVAVYQYQFDNDKLVKLEQRINGETSVIYDREAELNKLLEVYTAESVGSKKSIA